MSYILDDNETKETAQTSFQELMRKSFCQTKEVNFKPDVNVWYQGTLSSIVLTKTISKGYPSIKITFALSKINEKDKSPMISITHVLSNSAGVQSIKDIKVLLSSLGVSNKELNDINNIETEYKFVEYLQKFVGTKVRIMSLSDTSYKKYKIERLEAFDNE